MTYSAFCADTYEQLQSVLEPVSLFNVKLTQAISDYCHGKAYVLQVVDKKFITIQHDKYGVIANGIVAACNYIAEKNIYCIEFECRQIDHKDKLESIKREQGVDARLLKQDDDHVLLKPWSVNRVTGSIFVLMPYEKKLHIQSYIPESVKIEQIHKPVNQLKLNIRADWDICVDGAGDARYKITKTALELDKVKALLPVLNQNIGNYIVQHRHVKAGANYIADNQAAYDYDVTFKLTWSHTVHRSELCNLDVHCAIPDKFANDQVEEVDLTLRSDVRIESWATGKYYNITDKVMYRGQAYECTISHVSLEWFADKWQAIADISSTLYLSQFCENKSVLRGVFDVVKSFFHYNNHAFKMTIIVPVTAENIELQVGDYVDLSNIVQSQLQDIHSYGCISKLDLMYHAHEHKMTLEILIPIKIESTHTMNCTEGAVAYQSYDDQFPADVRDRVASLSTTPNTHTQDDAYFLINPDITLHNKVNIQAKVVDYV